MFLAFYENMNSFNVFFKWNIKYVGSKNSKGQRLIHFNIRSFRILSNQPWIGNWGIWLLYIEMYKSYRSLKRKFLWKFNKNFKEDLKIFEKIKNWKESNFLENSSPKITIRFAYNLGKLNIKRLWTLHQIRHIFLYIV